MSDFVSRAADYQVPNALPWLKEFNQASERTWQLTAFPHRKTEHWKYTSLRALEEGDFFAVGLARESLDESVKEAAHVDQLDSLDIVFVNGVYSAELSTSSEEFPEGLTLVRFADASPSQQEAIGTKLGSIATDTPHLFVTLNSSKLVEGVYLHVSRNSQINRTVRVLHITLGQEASFSVSPRLLVDLEEGAKASVVEHFLSDDKEQKCFVNAVTEIALAANANLDHYRLHLEHESSLHIGGVHANLERDAVLNSFQLALGGKLKRIDIVVNHQGQGSHSNLNGIYLPRNKQHVDFHTCIEHAVPHCTSNEVFRGIIGDSARAVFNGRIHIHKDAQKTLAQLSNKNLLTSNKAEVDTKPELEIYADDVQCAHGATVAQLDQNSVHYLMTRGVSREEALVMLSFGFINELINQVKLEPVAEYLRPRLAQLFARDPELLRHIA